MIYDFDDFTLDLRRFELSHRGQSIALEPQVFDVRAHLVENHDRVVTKGELLETPDLKEARALLEVAAR